VLCLNVDAVTVDDVQVKKLRNDNNDPMCRRRKKATARYIFVRDAYIVNGTICIPGVLANVSNYLAFIINSAVLCMMTLSQETIRRGRR